MTSFFWSEPSCDLTGCAKAQIKLKDLLKKFKVALPICTECKEKGLPVMKIDPFKWEPFYIINRIYVVSLNIP